MIATIIFALIIFLIIGHFRYKNLQKAIYLDHAREDMKKMFKSSQILKQ